VKRSSPVEVVTVLYEFGSFELDESAYELRRHGVRIRLERRVFDLLVHLVRNRARVVDSDELLAQVWRGVAVTRGSLARAVRLLRIALAAEPRGQSWIETAYGRGYRFVAPVAERAEVPQKPTHEAGTGRIDAFVGRDTELRVLESMLDRARAGSGSICFLSGEPGIGKTRLARELQSRARQRGMDVLAAWCHDGEGSPSYWPWIQIVRAHASSRAPLALRADLGPRGGIVSRTVPELREILPAEDSPAELSIDEARFHFFDSVSRLFLCAARRRPMLLFLDDLHSADGPSLRLLEFLARDLSQAPLIVVAAHRSAAVDLGTRARDVLASIGRHPHCVRLQLPGLAPEAVHAFMVAAGLGEQLDEVRVSQIHERTGGNPLFVRELIHGLALERSEQVPMLVRDLLMRRVSMLSPPTRRLLQAASTVGSEWPELLVRAISELNVDSFSAALDDALASDVIRPSTSHASFGFAHALFREALYDGLQTDVRQRLHRRAAEWLALQRDADPGEVAYHAYHSLALDAGRMARIWQLRAAERSMMRLAHEDAADHYGRALELHDASEERDDRTRCALLVGVGEARMRAGDRTLATRALLEAARLARALGSGALLARIALGLAPGLLALEIRSENEILTTLLSEALTLCSEDRELSSRLLSLLAVIRTGKAPREETAAQVERAVELAQKSDAPSAEAFARSARFIVRWTPDNLEERLAEAPDLLRRVMRSGDGELAVLCRVSRFATFLEAADMSAALRELDALEILAEEQRQPQAFWCRSQLRAGVAHFAGRFAEAARLRTKFARGAERLGDINAVHSAAIFDILLAWEEGCDDRAVDVLDQVRHIHQDWDNIYVHALARIGRSDQARILLRMLCEDVKREPVAVEWLCIMVNRAEACVLLRDRQLAELIYGDLLPYRSRIAVIAYGWGSWGSVERSLGLLATLLGRFTQAEEHFEEAMRVNLSLGSRSFVVHTQYGYAQMLLARDAPSDRARAARMIERALVEARILGMKARVGQLEKLDR
jgi:eukaryotic-like serine/threonine-protein kinase